LVNSSDEIPLNVKLKDISSGSSTRTNLSGAGRLSGLLEALAARRRQQIIFCTSNGPFVVTGRVPQLYELRQTLVTSSRQMQDPGCVPHSLCHNVHPAVSLA